MSNPTMKHDNHEEAKFIFGTKMWPFFKWHYLVYICLKNEMMSDDDDTNGSKMSRSLILLLVEE